MKHKIARKFKSIFFYTLKLGIAFSLVAYMIYTDKLDLKAVYSATNSPFFLLTAFIFILCAVFINFYRWYLLLKGHDIHLNFKEVVSLNFIGLFFTTVLPGAVGGDLIKSVYIAKKAPNKKTAAVLTVLLDRIVGLFALIVIGCVGLILNFKVFMQIPALKTLGISLYLVLFFISCFLLIGLSRRIYNHKITSAILSCIPLSNTINKIYSAFHAYREHYKMLLYSILVSFLTHAFNILSFYFITRALGFDDLSLYTYFFIVPVGMITTALPLAPAGIGIGQAAYLKLFEWSTGTPTTIGANAITVLQIFCISIFLCGGFFYITYKNKIKE